VRCAVCGRAPQPFSSCGRRSRLLHDAIVEQEEPPRAPEAAAHAGVAGFSQFLPRRLEPLSAAEPVTRLLLSPPRGSSRKFLASSWQARGPSRGACCSRFCSIALIYSRSIASRASRGGFRRAYLVAAITEGAAGSGGIAPAGGHAVFPPALHEPQAAHFGQVPIVLRPPRDAWTIPAASRLNALGSTTVTNVLSRSRRPLRRGPGGTAQVINSGHGATLHRLHSATMVHRLAARPMASGEGSAGFSSGAEGGGNMTTMLSGPMSGAGLGRHRRECEATAPAPTH
jgi:hypothetical protein